MSIKRGSRFVYWYAVAAIVFALVISVNFTKPFGFFRESNPALVAINARYWQQHPGVRQQHIPVSSYAFNKSADPASQFNFTITTFGFAWFEVPFWFIQVLGMEPGPVALRVFSLAWLVISLVLVFKLAKLLVSEINAEPRAAPVTVILYLFCPAVMWYQVNGYVHETAVLPFYFSAWYCFFKLLLLREQRWLWYTALFLLIGIQFDWLPFLQAAVMSVYLLFCRKRGVPTWSFLAPALAVTIGIAYIISTYSAWSGWQDYLRFMQWKFQGRTIGAPGHSFLSFWPASLNIVLFYIVSYGVLLAWVVIGLARKKIHPFVWLMIGVSVLHHIVFWGFSSEHDYAPLKTAFPLVFIAAQYLASLQQKASKALVPATLLLMIAQYFILHNTDIRRGIQADDRYCYRAGKMIAERPIEEIVFINTSGAYYPQVEFYAGRSYRMAVDPADAARQLETSADTASAVFIDVQRGAIYELTAGQR